MIKKILFGILGFIVLLIIGVLVYYRLVIYKPPAISVKDRAAVQMMPLPATMKLKTGKFEINASFNVSFEKYFDEKLKRALNRFENRLSEYSTIKFQNKNENKATLIINCLNGFPDKVQHAIEDESYKLIISSKMILLESNNPYGTFRGLETLLQLLEIKDGIAFFPSLEIKDEPRFPWRGLMIDVSRHWMPKEVILRNLNAMAAVKLNVLHLHLSDDQGFRVESKTYPRLHEIGSNGKYYTQDEIKEIVSFATDRGIRIVPEFDIPGHTKSWLMAYPELASAPGPFKFGFRVGELFSAPMDPTNQDLYLFLDKFIEEMAALFPDPYFHIGGDEINPEYWDNNENIQEFMKENNIENSHDLQMYFNLRINTIVKKHGKKMMGWEEILHPALGNDVVIQSWKSQKSLFSGVQQGGRAILSAGYYLDHKLHAGKHYLVDPHILPGAVDIEPDTSNWKMYNLEIEIPGNIMPLELALFDKDPQNIFGFFGMMDQRTSFRNAKITSDGQFTAEFNTDFGKMNYQAKITGDSIQGHIKFGVIKMESWGTQTGGSDMPGTTLPEIEVIIPLTEEEKARILGGEAAMWSEVVSSENIDSRLWPRLAAIAEKLWTPVELTSDVEDMYRRLEYINGYLTKQGVIHETQYLVMLKKLAGPGGYDALKTLVDVLEEVKYYNRLAYFMNMKTYYWPDIPLDGVADAARPESFEARRFNRLVDDFMDEPTKTKKNDIISQLTLWSTNHSKLLTFINASDKLKEIEQISAQFSDLSNIALRIIESGNTIDEKHKEEILKKLVFLENGENGVMVAVVPGIRRLVIAE